MKLLIISDIHGNLNAMNSMLKYIQEREIDSVALLGDLVDYGPHSNEVVELVSKMRLPFVCNIYGNHEDAMFNDQYDRFSTPRGVESAKYTKSLLSKETCEYIKTKMNKNGKEEFEIDGKKVLAVHGTIQDNHWGKFNIQDDLSPYTQYDFVLMGHSHLPFFYEAFFKVDNPQTRNKKKTIFINPGSIGQPRNINKYSQFAIFDTITEQCELIKISYDIKAEQMDFSDKIDSFYKTRLENGV